MVSLWLRNFDFRSKLKILRLGNLLAFVTFWVWAKVWFLKQLWVCANWGLINFGFWATLGLGNCGFEQLWVWATLGVGKLGFNQVLWSVLGYVFLGKIQRF